MAIKIEKNIDLWPRKAVRVCVYPLHDMEVGDSIFVYDFAASSARVQAAKHQRQFGTKFESRKVEGGIRIWRVE